MKRIFEWIIVVLAFVSLGMFLCTLAWLGATCKVHAFPHPIAALPGTGLFLMFAYLAYADRAIFLQSLQSLQWVKTDATIIEVVDNSFDIDSADQYTPARTTRYYEIKCTYKYNVDDRTYYGERHSFGGHLDQGWPRVLTGDRVSIFYDRNDPSQSVVRRGATPTLWFSPIGAVGALASIIWMFSQHPTGPNKASLPTGLNPSTSTPTALP